MPGGGGPSSSTGSVLRATGQSVVVGRSRGSSSSSASGSSRRLVDGGRVLGAGRAAPGRRRGRRRALADAASPSTSIRTRVTAGDAALDPGGRVVALDVDDLVAGGQMHPGGAADDDLGLGALLADQHEARAARAGRSRSGRRGSRRSRHRRRPAPTARRRGPSRTAAARRSRAARRCRTSRRRGRTTPVPAPAVTAAPPVPGPVAWEGCPRRRTARSPTSSAAGRSNGCPVCSTNAPISPLPPLTTPASSRRGRPLGPLSCARSTG